MKSIITCIVIFALFFSACGNSDAVTIIDKNTLNGSFETGQWSPWFDSGNVLVEDGSFASDGDYYAKLETTTGREGIFQSNLLVDKDLGSVFTFSVDARNGINPFDEFQISVSAWSLDGQYVNSSSLNIYEIPASAATEWVTFSGTTFFAEEVWQQVDPSRIGFSILFSETVNGSNGQGFIDNVMLLQVPEPATILLFTFSAIFFKIKIK